MRRKTFLNRLTLLGGGVVLLPSGLLQSCKYVPKIRTELTAADISLLDEVGETIIPTTAEVPGAKATKIGEYMVLMVKDCFDLEEQAIFLNGLNILDEQCAQTHKESFLDLDASQKLELIQQMQTEATAFNIEQEGTEKPLPHYFNQFKDLTISGYFTSEIGATQAMRYLSVPGKYEECIPYKKGDRPWVT
jgi:hypothetical protein